MILRKQEIGPSNIFNFFLILAMREYSRAQRAYEEALS